MGVGGRGDEQGRGPFSAGVPRLPLPGETAMPEAGRGSWGVPSRCLLTRGLKPGPCGNTPASSALEFTRLAVSQTESRVTGPWAVLFPHCLGLRSPRLALGSFPVSGHVAGAAELAPEHVEGPTLRERVSSRRERAASGWGRGAESPVV